MNTKEQTIRARTVALRSELRISLDAIRGLAALYVVAGHLFPDSLFPLFRFGQEAVILFFLLSGFVVHFNERERLNDIRGYALRRIIRIYPTLLAAMLISMAVALADGEFVARFAVDELLCTLGGVQSLPSGRPIEYCGPFMNNIPLWSLSFEVFFYLAYPTVIRAFWRRPGVLSHGIGLASIFMAIAYLVLPWHLVKLPGYFLVWWIGALFAERIFAPSQTDRHLRLSSYYLMATVTTWAGISALWSNLSFGAYPLINLRHFGAALIFVFVCLTPLGRYLAGAASTLGAAPWAYLASISYGLYVFHWPILIQWNVAKRPDGFLVALMILFVCAVLFDRQSNRWLRRSRRAAMS